MGNRKNLASWASSIIVVGLLLISSFNHNVGAKSWLSEQPDSIRQLRPTQAGLARQRRMAVQFPPANSSNKLETNSSRTLADFLLQINTRIEKIRVYSINLQAYRPEAKYEGDPAFVDSQDPAHKARCQRDLDFYKQTLESVMESDPSSTERSLDNWRLADSFGRPEAGALKGSQFWIGAYEQCLDTKVERADRSEAIESQYCLGLAQFPKWNRSDTKILIRVGLCLPVTCTSSMINDNAELLVTVERMMMTQFVSAGPYSKLKLDEVYCLPHKTSPIRQFTPATIGFFLLIGLFVTLSLIATIIDHYQTKRAKNSGQLKSQRRDWRSIVIESFSLIRSWNKFIHVRKESPEKQKLEELKSKSDTDDWWVYDRSIFLNSTNGIKCLGLVLIVCGHTIYLSPIEANNILDSDNLTKTFLISIYLIGHLMVDSFYVISALIATFFIFKVGIDKMKFKQWLVIILHRYWRLTPIYLIAFWFAKHVSNLINSGPMWDYGTSELSYRLNCVRQSWWVAFLHLGEFMRIQDHCVPVAYYIANEMKFFLLAPIFLILINKSPRRGYMFTTGIILASMAYVAATAMKYNQDIKMSLIKLKPETVSYYFDDLQEVYVRFYSRISTYLIGLIAGHLLYLAERQKLQIKIPKPVSIIIWTLVTSNILFLIFMTKIFGSIEVSDPILTIGFSIVLAIMRPIWALCLTWVIFTFAHGQARWLSRFLGAKVWQIMGKLCFSVYIVHGEVIAHCYWSSPQTFYFSYFYAIAQPITIVVMSLAIGLLVMLFIESPLIGLEEFILPSRPTRTKDENNQNSIELKNTKDETSH